MRLIRMRVMARSFLGEVLVIMNRPGGRDHPPKCVKASLVSRYDDPPAGSALPGRSGRPLGGSLSVPTPTGPRGDYRRSGAPSGSRPWSRAKRVSSARRRCPVLVRMWSRWERTVPKLMNSTSAMS